MFCDSRSQTRDSRNLNTKIDMRTSHELLEEGLEEALAEALGDRGQPLQDGRQQGVVQREVPDPRGLAYLYEKRPFLQMMRQIM